MEIKSTLLSLLVISSAIPGFSQDKKGNKQTIKNNSSFYFSNGIKFNKRTQKPVLLSGLKDKVTGNTPEEMAQDWLERNKRTIGLENTNDLAVSFKRSSLSGHNVRFQQFFKNVPVYNSQLTVHISPEDNVTYVDNSFDPNINSTNTTPSLSKNAAYNLAKDKIKASGRLSFSSNELFIYNKNETTQLIYKIIIESETPIGSWEILVDAHSGSIINAEDKAFYNDHKTDKKTPVNGTGNVYLSDPLSAANVTYGGNYTDNADATNAQLDAAMASVTLLDIDETGGVYTLKGPFAEIVDEESPFNGFYTQNSSTFNYNRNDDEFEAVNCYYHIDNSMRYINNILGITLVPYQYSGGVRFDPHGLGGADNSHYSGGSGNLAFGEGCVDDAEDADVIIHELGHGLHDWLTGGNASSSEGLGEGNGDYWAQSYGRSLNQWSSSDAEYEWMFNWDGHNECWNGRITNYTGAYTVGMGGSIHTNGQIWASTLMRIFDQIGRTKTDKAFLEGLAMTGSSSGQQDAAIAVRQAAIDMNYSCPDIDVFTDEFTATGYALPPYTCPVGIDELTVNNIELYPNPTKRKVRLILPNITEAIRLSLIDNLGRVVFETTTNDKLTEIGLEGLSKGMYTLLIKTNENVVSKKIVKK